ncbi:MAG TPA: hypothetical protein VE093_14195 [Polyangiaceae bacterium]|nr:hypothetical protein [Polyangiaceae bacterium]
MTKRRRFVEILIVVVLAGPLVVVLVVLVIPPSSKDCSAWLSFHRSCSIDSLTDGSGARAASKSFGRVGQIV